MADKKQGAGLSSGSSAAVHKAHSDRLRQSTKVSRKVSQICISPMLQ